jgi:hypothetical protein
VGDSDAAELEEKTVWVRSEEEKVTQRPAYRQAGAEGHGDSQRNTENKTRNLMNCFRRALPKSLLVRDEYTGAAAGGGVDGFDEGEAAAGFAAVAGGAGVVADGAEEIF